MGTPLSLYIHLPWCLHKCAYCDFNSHATDADAFAEQRYVARLIEDLTGASQQIAGRQVQSIFIGGGTPSLFSATSIDTILSACAELTNIQANCEVTLETNPGTFEADKFAEFHAAGVNRLSIGAQSFNNNSLQALDRIHSGEEALHAIHNAHKIGFNNINVDLMFGLPKQSLAQALEDVTTVCSLPITHVSYYQLTIEPNTVFHRFPPTLPEEDIIYTIQSQGLDLLERHGFQRYEVSAFAQKNSQCLHNCNYWQFGDYLGIGAGAHSKITTKQGVMRQQRTRQPESYMRAVETDSHICQQHIIDNESLAFEFMLNHLRLCRGFSIEDFARATTLEWEQIESTVQALVDESLLEICHHHTTTTYKATTHGYQFLDEVTQRFLPQVTLS